MKWSVRARPLDYSGKNLEWVRSDRYGDPEVAYLPEGTTLYILWVGDLDRDGLLIPPYLPRGRGGPTKEPPLAPSCHSIDPPG